MTREYVQDDIDFCGWSSEDELSNFYETHEQELHELYAGTRSRFFFKLNDFSTKDSFIRNITSETNFTFKWIMVKDRKVGFVLLGEFPEEIKGGFLVFLESEERGSLNSKVVLKAFVKVAQKKNMNALYALSEQQWQDEWLKNIGFTPLNTRGGYSIEPGFNFIYPLGE